MSKKEALKQFQEKYVEPKLFQKIMELDSFFRKYKESLSDDFKLVFREVCKKARLMQDLGLKDEISFIQISLLRVNILYHNYQYKIDCYNKELFFDQNECSLWWDVSWALKYMVELEDELLSCYKQFVGLITVADIERIKLQKVILFHQYIVNLLRFSAHEFSEISEFKELKKHSDFMVMAGEYFDTSVIVWRDHNAPKDKKQLKLNFELQKDNHFRHLCIKDLDLQQGNYMEQDFSYTRFVNINFCDCSFEKAVLIGTHFENCSLENTIFESSLMYDASFCGCNLANANFQDVQGNGGIYPEKVPSYFGVSFRNSDLENVNFEGAKLSGCNFKGVKFGNTNFILADLREVMIEKRWENKIFLTNEQRKGVYWI